MPVGIMNDILSANSPHSARFTWNITIHVVIPAIQIRAPIAENITSRTKTVIFNNTNTIHSKTSYHIMKHVLTDCQQNAMENYAMSLQYNK